MGKIYEALERQDKETQQVEQKSYFHLQLPLKTLPELVVLSRPGGVLAEQIRFLRSKIVRPESNKQRRSILITSTIQGEGKTFIAGNLATALALGVDEHVLVIDADLRAPRMHQVFGYDRDAPGLADHIEDEVPLSRVLRKTKIDKLTVLPSGKNVGNPTELLSSKRMQDLLGEVRDRYTDRFVIIDSPPLEIAPETVILSQEVDGTYMVVRAGSTPRGLVNTSKERLLKNKLLGIIFNGYEEKKSSYKYGMGYHSYRYKEQTQ